LSTDNPLQARIEALERRVDELEFLMLYSKWTYDPEEGEIRCTLKDGSVRRFPIVPLP
jgi:hypothetical protein